MDKKRVIAYIDGFNLYFGLKASGFNRFYWLNIHQLINSFVGTHQKLIKIKYFTSLIITTDLKKKERQAKYLDALQTLPDFEIVWGKYFVNPEECKIYNPLIDTCGGVFDRNNEKMTDVNIALSMVLDAVDNKYDTAILVSGDMDLFPAIEHIRKNFPEKVVSIFFPPKRSNNDMAKIASGSLVINKNKLKNNQFPDPVIDRFGEPINKPTEWV